MQIKDSEGNVLYKIEQSELFPDYRSVLLDAIANGIDLSKLYVENQNLEKIYFQGVNLNGAQFKNCNLDKVEFTKCNTEGILFDQCNLNGFKVKSSNLQNAHISTSNLSNARFIKANLNNSFIIDCNLEGSKFLQTQAENVSFHTSNLANTLFEGCSLFDAKFIHTSSTFEWLQDVTFSFCNLMDCDLSKLPNLSMLYINECNIHEAILDHHSFTKIINQYTTVLYAIDSNTIWWGSFRGTVEEFRKEIEMGFPITNVGAESEVFVYSELSKVLVYLEQWRNQFNS